MSKKKEEAAPVWLARAGADRRSGTPAARKTKRIAVTNKIYLAFISIIVSGSF
jgi:hypothetical protein